MPESVTLAMLAEKESPTLVRCLDSCADLVDEIVIVTQPGSSPEWKSSLDRFSPKLVEIPWPDDFSAARNESLRHATGEWVFYLDADEWLDEVNRERFRMLRKALSDADGAAGYLISQVSTEASGRIRALRQLRLFRLRLDLRWRHRVHEQIGPGLKASGGEVRETDIAIRHDGYVDRARLAAKRRRNARLLALDLVEHPDDPFVLFNAGIAALDAKRPAEAVRLLNKSRLRSNSSSVGPPLRAIAR